MCRYVQYIGVLDIIRYVVKHTLRRACTCARVCAVCSFALGEEGGGVQLVYTVHLLLTWDIILDMSLVCIFSIL